MHTFTESIHIERPRQQVWRYLVDPELAKAWVGFEQMDLIGDQPLAKGTRIQEVFRFLGKRMSMVDEVVEYQDGAHIAFRSVEAPIANEVDETLTDEDGGTRVELVMRTDDTQGFFGKLAEPVIERMFARELRQQLHRLKDLCEADAN
ncbi:MAG TPA: SRPBCC family protein [Egibacteraceae bacterium]|nr:SRPBCC family protein [Egibacteraceae bacterium]